MPSNQNKEEKSCRLQLPTLPCPGGNVLLAFVAPTQNAPFLGLRVQSVSQGNQSISGKSRNSGQHPRPWATHRCSFTLDTPPEPGSEGVFRYFGCDVAAHSAPRSPFQNKRAQVRQDGSPCPGPSMGCGPTHVVLEAKESAQWRSVLEAFPFRHPIPLAATQPFTRCPPSSSSCPTPHTTKRLLQPASPCPHRLTRGKSGKKKYATIILRASWPHQHQPAPLGSILWPRKFLSLFTRSPSPYLLGATAYPLFASYY